jgi:hypothetical protein
MSQIREKLKAAIRAMDNEKRVNDQAKVLNAETIGNMIQAKQETIVALSAYGAALQKEEESSGR